MLIINADDLGRTRSETAAALYCYSQGRITSATAMVFMADSERGAALAEEAGIDTGLHLNLTEPFSGKVRLSSLNERHSRIARFLTRHKYASLVYNPALRQDFAYVYQAQTEEFMRLYGHPPSHLDGHQHQHLCTNMLLGSVIPKGEKVRPGFHFWQGEKGAINRTYRHLVNRFLARSYIVADYFFALSQCLSDGRMAKVIALARTATVELMTHPINEREQTYLMSDTFRSTFENVQFGTYAQM